MKKKFYYLLMLVVAMVCTIGFASCNSDDDPVEKSLTYQISVTHNYEGVPTEQFLNEAEEIQNAYDNYFNADKEHKFYLTASDVQAQNERIASLGRVVNVSLSVKTWHYTFSVTITNITTGDTVFKATYRP